MSTARFIAAPPFRPVAWAIPTNIVRQSIGERDAAHTCTKSFRRSRPMACAGNCAKCLHSQIRDNRSVTDSTSRVERCSRRLLTGTRRRLGRAARTPGRAVSRCSAAVARKVALLTPRTSPAAPNTFCANPLRALPRYPLARPNDQA